jgi:hypothetical protein
MSRTCNHCRHWNPGTLDGAKTGFCRSRRHQNDAARELDVNPRQLGQLITWADNSCQFFSPRTPVRSGSDANTARH